MYTEICCALWVFLVQYVVNEINHLEFEHRYKMANTRYSALFLWQRTVWAQLLSVSTLCASLFTVLWKHFSCWLHIFKLQCVTVICKGHWPKIYFMILLKNYCKYCATANSAANTQWVWEFHSSSLHTTNMKLLLQRHTLRVCVRVCVCCHNSSPQHTHRYVYNMEKSFSSKNFTLQTQSCVCFKAVHLPCRVVWVWNEHCIKGL